MASEQASKAAREAAAKWWEDHVDNDPRRQDNPAIESLALAFDAFAAEQVKEARDAIMQIGLAIDGFDNEAVTREIYVASRARLAEAWPLANGSAEPLGVTVRAYIEDKAHEAADERKIARGVDDGK